MSCLAPSRSNLGTALDTFVWCFQLPRGNDHGQSSVELLEPRWDQWKVICLGHHQGAVEGNLCEVGYCLLLADLMRVAFG